MEQIEQLNKQVQEQRLLMQQLESKVDLADLARSRSSRANQNVDAQKVKMLQLQKQLDHTDRLARMWAEKYQSLESSIQQHRLNRSTRTLQDSVEAQNLFHQQASSVAITDRPVHHQSTLLRTETELMDRNIKDMNACPKTKEEIGLVDEATPFMFDSLLLQSASEAGAQNAWDGRLPHQEAETRFQVQGAASQRLATPEHLPSYDGAAPQSPHWKLQTQLKTLQVDVDHFDEDRENADLRVPPQRQQAAPAEPNNAAKRGTPSGIRLSPPPLPRRQEITPSHTLAKQPYHVHRLKSIGRISSTSGARKAELGERDGLRASPPRTDGRSKNLQQQASYPRGQGSPGRLARTPVSGYDDRASNR